VNVLEMLHDPELFGRTFRRNWRGADTWAAWRAFLGMLFGMALDDEARSIASSHTARTDFPSEPFREAFVIVGRRGGKSLISALVATYLACFRDYTEVLAPGEVGTLMVIAADRRQARVIFNYISAFLQTPRLKSMVASQLKESIALDNHVTIEIHTCSFRATRGYTLIGVIADEVAFWSSDNSANPDTEVLSALRPGLATTKGLLLGISSPYAKRGALFHAFRDHFGKPSDVLVWKATSREMNPTLSMATVAAAYARDTASARAEYGAEFRDDVVGFLSLEVIESCVVRGRLELPPLGDVGYAAFVDPSGGSSDSMTLAVAHREHERAVLDLVREVPAPFSPESVVQEFADTLKHYRISTVTGDRYAGEWPREQFAKRGIQYRTAEKTRSELYLELLPALTSGQAELLENKRLIAQLVGLERHTSRLGRDSVDHSPGSHDDVANAAAGALVEALGHEPVYAVLELAKEELAARNAQTVAKRADAIICPKCDWHGVAKRGPIFHCSRCGHEFGGPPKEVGPPPRAGLLERINR